MAKSKSRSSHGQVARSKRREVASKGGGSSRPRGGKGRDRAPSSRRAGGPKDATSSARRSDAPRIVLPPTVRRIVDAPWFWPAAIFVCAFVLRAIYVAQVRYTPFFQTLGLDAKFYDRWAREIALGTARGEAYFMTPLYPYFLAAIYRLFGRDLLLVRMIQAGLGSLSAVLIFYIGRDVFRRSVGVLSGLVAATYGALIFYDGSILLTPILVLLNVLALYLLIRADAVDRPAAYALAGLALGLAAVGRAAALLFLPAALVWVWLGSRTVSAGVPRDRGKSARGRGRRSVSGGRAAALVLTGVLIVLTPVAVRNYVVSRDFVLVTSNGGLNFYVGNSEKATGGYVRPEGLDIITDPDGEDIAERALGRDLRPSEVSSYWYSRARGFIARNPGTWLKLLVRKLSFSMSSYELPQLENYYFQSRYSKLLALPLPGFAIVAPLGLVGLGLSLRRRRSRLLSAFFVLYIVSIVAFFVLARYRMPAVPALIVGASYVVLEFLRWARAREWRRFAWPGVALVALVFLVNANLYGVDRGKGFAQSHYRLGIIYGDRGMTDRAIAEYRRSIEIDPNYPKSHLNLGALLFDAGQEEEAIEGFHTAIRLDPAYTAARLNLALAYDQGGAYDASVAELDSVLAYDPHNAMALKQQAITLFRMGRTADAVAGFEEAARWDVDGRERAEIEFYQALMERPTRAALPQAAVAEMALADSLMRTGRTVESIDAFGRAASLAPASGEPIRRLALLKREMGLHQEAVDLMERALKLDPALVDGHFTMGVFLNELQRHDEAIRSYGAQLRITPDHLSSHLNLALTLQFHAGNPNLAAYHYRRYLALGGERVGVGDDLLRTLADAPESP